MESQHVKIREFEGLRDVKQVECLEKRCEVGPSGKISLFTDLMGDPICRVRHSPAYVMLVAELGPGGEIVGLIRGCIKTVTCGKKTPTLCAKAAYILGLRVSPTHRRMGIGLKLVQSLERWFKENGAEYAYMATEKENEACIKLFDGKLNYKKFRTPAILVHPVYAHSRRIRSSVKIQKLGVQEAESLYRLYLGTREFFPQDIDAILKNRLSLGTWAAFPQEEEWPRDGKNAPFPTSWAILSVWNSSDVFKLEVKGVSRLKYLLAATTRFFDGAFPWLKIPSIPDVFHPFGLHFLYGLHAEGIQAQKLMKELYWFAHNMARKNGDGCRLIATEVGSCDPLRPCIPYWDCFSCPEDLWCIKKLKDDSVPDHDHDDHHNHGDWTKSTPEPTLFVDPRDF
ncbi:hypothetical protein SUGI_0222980 [Cryptomeria japonica]|uniref:probable N-acetyltransferase HLS1 n=1 Tax=Cryptomeria japonica TaxID=3369 RepID=UPI002408BE6F|nr:probable N-acetyltransferase HLS1 [Cryptomeria japonica]GLJ13947.1 hypothetical protein SUGI_0222980 [Cryptomeria japonica]